MLAVLILFLGLQGVVVYSFLPIMQRQRFVSRSPTYSMFSDSASVRGPRDLSMMMLGVRPKTSKRPAEVTQLLKSVRRSQSPAASATVEQCISQLSEFAQKKPAQYLKKDCTGVWKTVWTSVSSGEVPNIFGWGTSPANILGGSSYQIVFPNGAAENIVWWPSLWDIRMVGRAQLSSLSPTDHEEHKIQAGYNLVIKGLEFRYGSPLKVPEVRLSPKAAKSSDDVISKGGGKRWSVFALGDDDEPLANGSGTLQILYNDVNLRVTRDLNTKIAYVHTKVA